MTVQVDFNALIASGSKAKQNRPPIVIAHADRGLGKTTFGAQFPKPAFLCGEDGAHSIADFRWPSEGAMDGWGQLLNYTRAFAYGNHDFKSLVSDTLGPFSFLCLSHTILQSGKGSWEKMGWGKEEDLVREWRVWLSLLEHCRNKRGMNIVLLAHSVQKKVSNTQLPEAHYVYRGDMHDALWQFTSNWADIVLYGSHGYRLEEQEHGKARAVHDGNRYFFAQSDTGFEAKVRGGYWLPAKFKLDYQTFCAELSETPIATRDRIKALLPTLTAENAAPHPLELVRANIERFIKECGDNVGKLRALEAQVKKMKEPKDQKT
jgi:hypothetical protein